MIITLWATLYRSSTWLVHTTLLSTTEYCTTKLASYTTTRRTHRQGDSCHLCAYAALRAELADKPTWVLCLLGLLAVSKPWGGESGYAAAAAVAQKTSELWKTAAINTRLCVFYYYCSFRFFPSRRVFYLRNQSNQLFKFITQYIYLLL